MKCLRAGGKFLAQCTRCRRQQVDDIQLTRHMMHVTLHSIHTRLEYSGVAWTAITLANCIGSANWRCSRGKKFLVDFSALTGATGSEMGNARIFHHVICAHARKLAASCVS